MEERNLDGYISAISFNNVFYIARKQSNLARATEAVRLIRESFRVVPLDEAVIDQAIAAQAADFEDAIQAASARRVGAEYLVTRSAADFPSMGLRTVTAEELLALIDPPGNT